MPTTSLSRDEIEAIKMPKHVTVGALIALTPKQVSRALTTLARDEVRTCMWNSTTRALGLERSITREQAIMQLSRAPLVYRVPSCMFGFGLAIKHVNAKLAGEGVMVLFSTTDAERSHEKRREL